MCMCVYFTAFQPPTSHSYTVSLSIRQCTAKNAQCSRDSVIAAYLFVVLSLRSIEAQVIFVLYNFSRHSICALLRQRHARFVWISRSYSLYFLHICIHSYSFVIYLPGIVRQW